MGTSRRWIVNIVKKAIDTLTGASVKEAVDKNAKTAADVADAVKKAREKIDAERTAEERRTAKAGNGK